MTPAGRRTPPAEDGFALIEVLVSALVLAIVAAGVMALLQATTRSAADERRHAEAYAVSQEDQARLRSMRLSALNRMEQTRTVTVDGNEFTVVSQGVFVNNTKGQPSSCTSGETAADYVRITSTTSWPGSRQPVVIQSIVSPSNGSLDPNHGTLVVTTKNAAGEALANVGLSGTGAGSFSATSDATGCANFADLPAGNYEVTPNAPGLVDVHGESAVAQKTSVIAGGTNTLQLQLDYGATLPVKFKYRVGSSSEFKAAKVDSVLVFNVLMNPAKPYWTPTKTRQEEIVAAPIFPFTSPDTVYAGACELNNPGSGAAQGSVTLSPGKTYSPTLELQVPALELTIKSGSSTIITGAKIIITDENCKVGNSYLAREYTSESKGHQSSASNGQAEYGLPYGTYTICASANISGTNRRLYSEKVKVQSLTSSKVETLDLSGSGSEKNRTCP
ncbi:MAG: prepilin-type N-terminal cleavage/methylation domain-containing protein [Solirubrobacterales bacterium]